MKISTLWLLILLIGINTHAGINDKNFGTATCAEITSIYDGDTFRCTIAGYPGIVGERIGIRVNGIDTPEMRGKCDKEKKWARKAKQFAVQMLRSGDTVELRNMKRGKYFRIVADVYIDGVNLTNELIKNGLGVEYHGGKKSKNWCQ